MVAALGIYCDRKYSFKVGHCINDWIPPKVQVSQNFKIVLMSIDPDFKRRNMC